MPNKGTFQKQFSEKGEKKKYKTNSNNNGNFKLYAKTIASNSYRVIVLFVSI